MNENYSLSYSSRDKDTRDTILDLNVNFEDPAPYQLKKNLNTWLTAIGLELEVVDKVSSR